MIRLVMFFLFLLMLPLIIMLVGIFFVVIYALIKLNFIKAPFNIKTKIHNMRDTVNPKKSFAEKALRQFSCKHSNLEQKNDILLCCDCGKIIQ